ncbi:MAG: DUF6483 family protein [Tissierellia bacterium]|nr:DUF6483 family protein [Tissierellia bacterium]
MYFKDDWLLDRIAELIDFLVKILFNEDLLYLRDQELIEEDAIRLDKDLKDLLSVGKFSEAEDILFDNLDSTSFEHLKVAILFYNRLNKFTERELEAANFPRREILDGLADIGEIYDLKFIKPSIDKLK